MRYADCAALLKWPDGARELVVCDASYRGDAACAGDDMDKDIEVEIGQFVKMMKDGQEVRLSKRAGNIITLDDVVDLSYVHAAAKELGPYAKK